MMIGGIWDERKSSVLDAEDLPGAFDARAFLARADDFCALAGAQSRMTETRAASAAFATLPREVCVMTSEMVSFIFCFSFIG
jgi:hypothetical protein